MLGLRGSLSLPSLLLPLDPVTPRRLCVRGAFTAATRESIQICVCGQCVCVLLVLSEPYNFTVAISACLLSFLACLCARNGGVQQQQQYTRKVSGEQSRAEHLCRERKKRQSVRDGTENHRTQKRAATRQVTAGRRCVRASPHAVQHATHNRE
ncbi:hypothetical protein TCDM_12890 [Trypanosoma cruzi Dm28c]|uniref:Uncharacterized protein n=1 Tax=Trypanosoma cruzi Dm28c TaxID=1416333 RepID=V5A4E7_TRYCR|nr:hypothetical protein TCDM_12890 [Trypanosoma cruzi Dm28c]